MSEAPLCTYRLQLGPDLTFADAAGLVPYLAELGVSHVYLSPVLEPRPGSTHGYDVADPTRVSSLLGGEAGLRALAEAARAAGLGLVVDLVPNHLGTGFATPLWRSLLAEGRAGPAGEVFDVDWATPLPGAAGKVVIPALGDQYGEVLRRGELRVVQEGGERRLAYFDARFPLSGDPPEAGLHALLERQHYRLVHWRAGQGLVNYRRFFSIDELAGVRVEDPAVFELTHAKVLELVAQGLVDGLRIDHPDGLRDPARYLARLAERTGGVWTVVEKITAPGEALPDWPVAGTTGYEFANDVVGLFVDPAARDAFDALDAELGGGVGSEMGGGVGSEMGGGVGSYDAQVEDAKRAVLATELAADIRRLARLLWGLTARHLEVRDVDEHDCLAALVDVLVRLRVYRTYVDPQTGAATPIDVERVETAVAAAERRPNGPPALYPFLARALTGRAGTSPPHLDLLARAQQLTGALTAKGVEDTAFYRYRRLLALNEVGGDPSVFGIDAATFHARCALRAQRHPAGLLSTTTHDTKRSEDARLRVAALSELPERWTAAVRRWSAAPDAPDGQTQLLLYQTLVAVWPPSGDPAAVRDRVAAYLVKAGREAGQRTSWRDPDPAFEAAVERFLDRILADPAFVAELGEVAAEAFAVAVHSGLAQVLLRCTSPGVPDTYQGTEVWDTSLVDPDNRRPVDWAARRAVLAALPEADPARLMADPSDGRVKAYVLTRSLQARRDAGATPGYLPLTATGALAEHVVAYARTDREQTRLVAVAPRLPGAVLRAGGWSDTTVALPGPGPWVDVFTGAQHDGAELPLAQALAVLPVALLGLPER